MTPLAAFTAFPVQPPPPLPKPEFTLAPVSPGILTVCAAIHLLYASLRLMMHTPLLAVQDVGGAGIFAVDEICHAGVAARFPAKAGNLQRFSK